MKHLSFTLLLLLVGISPAFAQQKWELGLTAQMGNFTTPLNAEFDSDFYRERSSVSAGITTIFGVYAQRHIFQYFALSIGLGYSISEYSSHHDTQNKSGLEREDVWTLKATERNTLLQVALHWQPKGLSRWSLGTGATLSIHANTDIKVSYHAVNPAPALPWLIGCIDDNGESIEYAPAAQLLWNGSIAYHVAPSTSIGLTILWSPKPNEGPCQRYFYPDGYFQTKSTQQTLESYQRLLLFPKSLAISMRHNFLNTN